MLEVALAAVPTGKGEDQVTSSSGSTAFPDAFPDLYRLAYQVAYRILGDRGDAEDVAQEALARALDPLASAGRPTSRVGQPRCLQPGHRPLSPSASQHARPRWSHDRRR